MKPEIAITPAKFSGSKIGSDQGESELKPEMILNPKKSNSTLGIFSYEDNSIQVRFEINFKILNSDWPTNKNFLSLNFTQ